MNIKTITTTDGVNVVDFGSSVSCFYWFKNIGTSTVYVSGGPDITADGDWWRKNAVLKKIWDEIGDVNAVLETVTGGVT